MKEKPHHIDFCVGVAHIAYNTTVFHAVQMLPRHYILISYKERRVKAEERDARGQRCRHVSLLRERLAAIIQHVYVV